jgi:Mg2+-importing ATPase
MTFSRAAATSASEVLQELGSTPGGLDAIEAARRLRRYGRNEFSKRGVRWQAVLVRQFASPFIYLLVAAAALAWGLGETVDAVMIGSFVAINAGLGFAQEYHSERSVEMLRSFVRAKSRVRRDGGETVVDSAELVPGDVVVVETGDMVHADVRWIEQEDLAADESALTGESVPIKKTVEALAEETVEPYRAINVGFAGTTVVSGRAVGVVFATGDESQIGEVAKLARAADGTSGFEKNLGAFSSFILRVVLVTLVAVFAANVLIKGNGANVPDLLIFSVALAVSVIPEALPLVTTTTLSRGALRLARRHVVVRRLSAIEDLGSIQVLCTDKTGTLTENKLAVADVFGRGEEAVYAAAVASSFLGERRVTSNNAFDLAAWDRLSEPGRDRARAARRAHEIPFDPSRRWNSVVADGRLIVRGAPEEVAALCVGREHGGNREADTMLEWAARQGRQGRRVIAVADREAAEGQWRAEDGCLSLVGALAFEDPVKDSARAAVAHAKRLGVAVKILTGDSREVAASVAREVGLIQSDAEVMTGEEWERLPEEERLPAIRSHGVFARVSPRQKFLMVQAQHGCCEVGFLGEGINDAPALKMASVGIVVDGASDVAREAADIVLLRHSLEVVVDGIREGRSVFANTVKYVKATLASNFGNFFAVAAATLLVDFLPMLPVQLLLVNLLSDFPMIAIAADSVDPDELGRPRSYDLRDIMYVSAVLGVVSAIFDFVLFGLFYRVSPEVLQTNWFVGSILTELLLIFAVRTRGPFWKAVKPAPVLFWLTAAAFVTTLWIPFTRTGTELFHFARPSFGDLCLILGVVAAYFAVTETVKLFAYRLSRGLAKSPARG